MSPQPALTLNAAQSSRRGRRPSSHRGFHHSLALLLSLAAFAQAIDWPRFRGPNGSASMPDAQLPLEFKSENTIWKVPIPGKGDSSPVIFGNRLFITSASDNGEERALFALDVTLGTTLWSDRFPMTGHKKHEKNSYATATPAVDDKVVVVEFTSEQRHLVRAYEPSTGTRLWEKDLGPFISQHGSGASPVLYENLVVICNEQEDVPEKGRPPRAEGSIASFIVAFDKMTGNEAWRLPRRLTNKAPYATPFILSGAKPQLVVASTAGLSSLEPTTGKVIWTADVFKERVVACPLEAAGLVIANSGDGGQGKRMVAFRPDGLGDVTASHQQWEETTKVPYCTTPVAVGDNLFMITDGGILRCLNVKTREGWDKRIGGKFSSSPVVAGDKLILVNEQGDVLQVQVDPKKYLLKSTNKIDDVFYSTPALSRSRLYLRGARHLWCIGQR